MFEQSLMPDDGTKRLNRLWAVGLAIIGQALVVGILIIIPMLYAQVLPAPALGALSIPLALPPPPVPPPPRVTRDRIPRAIPRKFDPNGLIEPIRIPKHVPIIPGPPAELADSAVVRGVPGGVTGGLPGGQLGGLLSPLPKLPPPPAVKHVVPSEPALPRIEVGGQVEAALLVHEVKPRYPVLARHARIAGTVEMKAIIGPDGSVQNLTFISGPPLLVQAAMEAVEQWRYRPTLLNGKPVEVSTEIEVHFTLSS